MLPQRGVRVGVLEEDPDLAVAIPREHLDLVRQAAIAPLRTIRPGEWRYPTPQDPAVFGLLVLDGLVGGRVSIPERSHLELLGPGDVLRPWVSLGETGSIPSEVDWRVFDAVRLAVLDRQFMQAVRAWPEVCSALAERLVLRARRLSFQLAVTGITGVEDRLSLMLWHFADQWGHVTPEGVRLRLPLTHAQLSEVVAASRPTVSTALAELRRSGTVSSDRRGDWLVHGSPPERFWELKEQLALRSR